VVPEPHRGAVGTSPALDSDWRGERFDRLNQDFGGVSRKVIADHSATIDAPVKTNEEQRPKQDSLCWTTTDRIRRQGRHPAAVNR
jgi:hypothetical protein